MTDTTYITKTYQKLFTSNLKILCLLKKTSYALYLHATLFSLLKNSGSKSTQLCNHDGIKIFCKIGDVIHSRLNIISIYKKII